MVFQLEVGLCSPKDAGGFQGWAPTVGVFLGVYRGLPISTGCHS